MPDMHLIHITTSVRGSDGNLVAYNLEFDQEVAADDFVTMLSHAIPERKVIKIVEEPHLQQVTYLNAGLILEVRRRHKHSA